ncbi:alpha/beta hydrolase [Thermomonospora amylolytica]|uniref:alpha/beta hydrolase n=1 Tax=Thermomonospora amylolytica TaxID=1411117 RepID=UPI000E6D36E2|nr:alpha/beta fold hydrolase [Thermomonospora amylolytica]
MSAAEYSTAFSSLDGLRLHGTLVMPTEVHGPAVVLVHGGGVTREEGGFFTQLADGLADIGLPSLRFDFRAHGESEGRQEDLTLSGVVNDIRAAVEHVRAETGSGPVSLIGASFGGGICAFYASRHPESLHRLVLFNPLLDYKRRFVDEKPYWHGDRIDEEAGRELAAHGHVAHSPTFKLGRALLNEVFYLAPHRELGKVTTPTLILHGTGDTFIPVQSSRDAVGQFGAEAELIEIEGAQHGFAVHDDPQYADPQTQKWQAYVIRTVAHWLSGARPN